jgi:hypothetical protein
LPGSTGQYDRRLQGKRTRGECVESFCNPVESDIMKTLLLLMLLIATPLFGAECPNDVKKKKTFSLYFENDFFGNTDNGYTNGT